MFPGTELKKTRHHLIFFLLLFTIFLQIRASAPSSKGLSYSLYREQLSFMLTQSQLPAPALCVPPGQAAWTGSRAAHAQSALWLENPASSPLRWRLWSAPSKTLSCCNELLSRLRELKLRIGKIVRQNEKTNFSQMKRHLLPHQY